MPRPKTAPVEPDTLRDESNDIFTLLKRVGAIIVTRNALGRRSDKFCRLCSQARLLKVPCPHTQIWELTK